MIKIVKHILTKIEEYTLECFPNEACGLLIGNSETISDVVPTTNISENKKTEYLIDPFEMVQVESVVNSKGLDIIGTFHSHPNNSPFLSPTDLMSALSNWYYLLASTNGEKVSVTLWKLHGNSFKKLDFELIPA